MGRAKIVLTLFTAAVATDLLAIVQEMEGLRLISKSVLMPLLMVYAFLRFSKVKSIHFWLLLGALFLSWIGDILLLFDSSQQFFMFGLLSFLLGHVTYIILYGKAKYPDTKLALMPTQQMRYLFILVLAGSAVIYVLYPHLSDLKLPVILYAIVLTYMSVAALYRYGRTSGKSFALIFSGALLFMLSDSMLAVNKFVETFSYAGFWIMFTYSSAQFLIVEGVAVHVDGEK